MTDAHEPRPGGEIVVYDAPDGEVTLNVRLEQETVWLTRERMAAVFAATTENVRQHLRNVFVDGELEESATTEDFLVVRSERCRWVRAHRGSAAASPTRTAITWETSMVRATCADSALVPSGGRSPEELSVPT